MISLRDWLTEELRIRDWSQRDAAAAIGISKSGLQKLLTADPPFVPELATLSALSETFGMPLARLVEMCGFDLDNEPRSTTDRVRYLVAAHPQIAHLLERLPELSLDDAEATLAYVEGRLLLRESRRQMQQG